MAMITSRTFVMNRRSNGIGDLSTADLAAAGVDMWSKAYIDALSRNSFYQIGLGTENEVGLELARYPIRVILSGGAPEELQPTICIKWWAVINAEGQSIGFTRTNGVDAKVVENMYRAFENFDGALNDYYTKVGAVAFTIRPEITPDAEKLYEIASLANPSGEQYAEITTLMKRIFTTAITLNTCPYFQVGNNLYLLARRHGASYTGKTNKESEAMLASELAATFLANYTMMNKRYPAVCSGLKVTCAYAIAWAFSMGWVECFESKEFVTMQGLFSEDRQFTVKKLIAPADYVWDSDMTVGKVLDCAKLNINGLIMKVAPALTVLAGINHYSFNHTTGGNKASGPMLSTLMMYNLFDTDPSHNLEEEQTRLLYEALHPINKRGIANLVFRDCHVYSWGRPFACVPMQIIAPDQFMNVRDRPVPAGAHKAYLAGTALSRILNQKFATFLPWAGEIDGVIRIIEQTVRAGAKCHVGAAYYTGSPGVAQGAALDMYLPDLAQYIHVMSPKDTLALSAHLSKDVATRADPHWTHLLKKIKGHDVSSVSAEVVEEYLKSTGSYVNSFNPEDKNTWALAAKASHDQSKALLELMRLA